jgi:hypothetical protein
MRDLLLEDKEVHMQMYALVASLGNVCYHFHMHCGSSLLCHTAASNLLFDQRPCVLRPACGKAKQSLDVVQYRACNISIAKSKRIILACSRLFCRINAQVAAQKTSFASTLVSALIGGVTGATSKACSVALVNNTG